MLGELVQGGGWRQEHDPVHSWRSYCEGMGVEKGKLFVHDPTCPIPRAQQLLGIDAQAE